MTQELPRILCIEDHKTYGPFQKSASLIFRPSRETTAFRSSALLQYYWNGPYLATMIEWLQRLPAEVHGAMNGVQAVELLSAARRDDKPYDLVVMDNYVPREAGDQISLDAAGEPVPDEAQKFGLQMLTGWTARYQLLPRRIPIIPYRVSC